MGNSEKRKKRAKTKAKQSRLQKQKSRELNNEEQVAHITPELVDVFETLPGFSPEYEAVPHLKQYALSNGKIHHDLEMSVALLYVMYGHWKTTGSDGLFLLDLMTVAEELVEHPKFLEQFYSDSCALVV